MEDGNHCTMQEGAGGIGQANTLRGMMIGLISTMEGGWSGEESNHSATLSKRETIAVALLCHYNYKQQCPSQRVLTMDIFRMWIPPVTNPTTILIRGIGYPSLRKKRKEKYKIEKGP